MGLGGRSHAWDMDALRKRMESARTLSWLGHGCSAQTDGVCEDAVMVGTWMPCASGWSLQGRYHAWDMDALRKRMEPARTLSWLGHGCSAQSDGVFEDAVMLGTWMLCANGWSLRGRYHGWDMDALRKRMESARTLSCLGHGFSAQTDGVFEDAIMAKDALRKRMLRGRCHGWDMDALRKRMESARTLSCLGHGCSAQTDGVCEDAIMVGTRMLCANGWSLRGRCHGWDMDAMRKRMESARRLSWLGLGCSAKMDGVGVDVIMLGTWMLCGNGWGLGGCSHGWEMDVPRHDVLREKWLHRMCQKTQDKTHERPNIHDNALYLQKPHDNAPYFRTLSK